MSASRNTGFDTSGKSRTLSLLVGLGLLLGPLAAGCGGDNFDTVPVTPVGPEIHGLHTVGGHLEDNTGTTVTLRGVNRSGSEYMCVKGGTVFDGAWGLTAIGAIATWKANVVRVPLNEYCWLDTGTLGANYRMSIALFVSLLHQYHIVPILELHWAAPGTMVADEQQPMPDADHSVDFWTDVARTFASDDGVVFELYNEPYPDSDRDSDAGWQCWRDGCAATLWMAGKATTNTYEAVGMAALVSAIRTVAPNHLILLGGLQYSNALTQWMAYAPADNNIAPAWHVYSFNSCKSEQCWDVAPASVAMNLPLIVTELGEDDCAGGFIEPFMQWLDGKGASYLAWSWNSAPSCIAGRGAGSRPWPLVVDYMSGNPSGGYAQSFHDHLAMVVGASAGSPAP
jgi:endoglucanase